MALNVRRLFRRISLIPGITCLSGVKCVALDVCAFFVPLVPLIHRVALLLLGH